MRELVRKNFSAIEWILGALSVVLPIVAWLSENDLVELTLYDVFPPLGLVAFGLMWTHFVMGALRRYSGAERSRSNLYMPISMGLVLALIILHPLLLWIALYKDGFGLPPFSYMKVYETQLPFLALGTISLFIFLSYEFKRFFGERKWWKYVERIQIVGMAAIFVHGLGLGNELRVDWMMAVWLFYGATLFISVMYSQMKDKRNGGIHGA